MSNGIMEKDLPVAESIGEGDKVRIVTSAGNSKNVDASQIGGGAVFVNVIYDQSQELYRLDKTWGDVYRYIQQGMLVYIVDNTREYEDTASPIVFIGYDTNYQSYNIVYFASNGYETYSAESENDYPIV